MALCRNPKLWIVLAAAAVALVFIAPNPGTVLAILVFAACPLSMLVMAGGMARMGRSQHDAPATGSDDTDRITAGVPGIREHSNH